VAQPGGCLLGPPGARERRRSRDLRERPVGRFMGRSFPERNCQRVSEALVGGPAADGEGATTGLRLGRVLPQRYPPLSWCSVIGGQEHLQTVTRCAALRLRWRAPPSARESEPPQQRSQLRPPVSAISSQTGTSAIVCVRVSASCRRVSNRPPLSSQARGPELARDPPAPVRSPESPGGGPATGISWTARWPRPYASARPQAPGMSRSSSQPI
jgi:hypothetical protein